MGNNTATYQAIIFDLDGTLLNTLEDIGDSVNQMLAEYAFPGHTLDDYRRFIGNGIQMLVKRALPVQKRSEAQVHGCVKRAREIYWDNWNRKTRPYDGVEDLLKKLEEKKIPKAVLSNKPHDFTVRYVDAYFSDITFETVRGQSDLFPIKPDPSAALDIAERAGLPPQDFLFVGDSVVDIKTAVSAGMHAVGVSWGFKGPKALLDNGCEFMVHDPMDIDEMLKRQGN
jgi:phosphoglycolate phosphatase